MRGAWRSAIALAALWLGSLALPQPAWANCSDISGLPGPRQPCPDRNRKAAAPPPVAPQQQRNVVTAPAAPSRSSGSTAAGVLSGVGGLLSVIQTLNPPEAEAGEAEEAEAAETLPPPNPRGCTERDRQRGCLTLRGDAADFSGQIRSDDTYEMNLADKSKKRPVTKCDDRGCWIEYVSVQPVPKKSKRPNPAGPDPKLLADARKDLEKLKNSAVPPSDHKTLLFSKYPADVVNYVMP